MMNLFWSTTFNGVRAYALDRRACSAAARRAIGFITAADVGASYSFVAATFKAGDPPPRAGMKWFWPSCPATGVTLTQVHARFFHVDFVTPANSVFGLVRPPRRTRDHVNGFVDAYKYYGTLCHSGRGSGYLGQDQMTPVFTRTAAAPIVWADQTILLNYPNDRLPCAGINSMLPAAISLLRRFNNKTGPITMTVYGAGCPA